MRRHVIIGRFGTNDRTPIPASPGEISTRLEFVVAKRRLEHGIGDAIEELVKLRVFPSEIGVDLLMLAAHVYAADTRISRATESQDAWTREMRLVVPVSDVAKWKATIPLLERILNFLTGDRWMIGFRLRPAGFERVVPPKGFGIAPAPYNALSLFSGGLDSLIGAIDLLEQGKKPLFISHAGEGATSDSQSTVFRRLKRHYAQHQFDRLRVWMSFPSDLVRNVDIEASTRARSFLFFAAGVLAGTGMDGAFTLRVPENGLIALNVPLDPLRLGALSTRTTHPFYMARWNDLLGALGVPGRLENPYLNLTKGEMVAGPRYFRSLELQKQAFEHILRHCAKAGGKILTIHSVRAAKAVLDMIEAHLPARAGKAVLHWFNGSKSDARRAVDLGCYFSVNARMLETDKGRDLVNSLPMERILTETDGPFTQINERPSSPADVAATVSTMAGLRQISPQELASNISKNLQSLLSTAGS